MPVKSIQMLEIVQLEHTDSAHAAFQELFLPMQGRVNAEVLEALQSAVLSREEASSTYLDRGLAVPHGRIPQLDSMTILVGASRDGVLWDAAGHKVFLAIMLGVPETMISGYLMTMQKILRWHKQSKLIDPEGRVADPLALKAELEGILK